MTEPTSPTMDTVETIIELLDDVTAALESCVATYGSSMSSEDQLSRAKLVKAAQQMVTVHGAKQPYTVVLLDEDLNWRDPVFVVARHQAGCIGTIQPKKRTMHS